jgi:uncharacterized protein YbbC (DUF1343 family)
MKKTTTGLVELTSNTDWQNKIRGKVALLCHSASVTPTYSHAVIELKKIFGSRLVKIFGPQHGFVTDVQDNMVETKDYIHPYFKLPVHSLYSETRVPTEEMLENVDTMIIDLQDVGTRVYTYISTMTLVMEACGKKDIDVVILDRPNPIGGEIIEGNLLDENFKSFVGRHPVPMRHGMTMGEYALFAHKFYQANCNLTVIPMKEWRRELSFDQTGLPWVLPSPNLPTIDGAFTFVGTVLFEGTNISEGRGTTRSLEIVGHPKIPPFELSEKLNRKIGEEGLTGVILRPLVFLPTFQKHQGVPCGGFQIHVTNKSEFRSWKLGQFLCQQFFQELSSDFEWKLPPYEYEFEKLPIDLINGSSRIREWVEKGGSMAELESIEREGLDDFLNKRCDILLYN